MNTFMIIAAVLNFLAAGMHLAIPFVGPDGYRKFGAGEKLATMAERGHYYPALLTVVIAAALIIAGLYCLSYADALIELPYTESILWLLTGIYLVRAAYPLILSPWVAFFRSRFMVVTSLICGVFGLVHLQGL